MHHGLRYVGGDELMLRGFVNFDLVGDLGSRKSTSGCCFNLV